MNMIKDCQCGVQPIHQAHHPDDGSLIFAVAIDNITEEEGLLLFEKSIDRANKNRIKKLKN